MTKDPQSSELDHDSNPTLLAMESGAECEAVESPQDESSDLAVENETADGEAVDREDEIHTSILEMKKIVQETGSRADASSVIGRLDEVQDRLISNLELLNKRIENYIELLANQRKTA